MASKDKPPSVWFARPPRQANFRCDPALPVRARYPVRQSLTWVMGGRHWW